MFPQENEAADTATSSPTESDTSPPASPNWAALRVSMKYLFYSIVKSNKCVKITKLKLTVYSTELFWYFFFYWILPVISIDAKRRLCFIWTFKTCVIIILFSLISAVIEIRPNYFCSLISTNFTLQGQTCHEQTWSFFFSIAW